MSISDREIWAYENDLLCAHHIDYIDCGDCTPPEIPEDRHVDQ